MNCPNCAAALTADNLPVDGKYGTCPQCARSIAMDTMWDALDANPVRLATSADLEHLSDAQIKTLRASRPSNWRQSVLATKARLRG